MKKKINDGTGNIARGTAIIIIAMVIVFGAVFAWMYSMDMLFLPSFVEDLIGKNDDELSWDLGALSELVKSGKDESGESVTFDVSYENLRTALLESEREDGIYISADIKYFAGTDAYIRRVIYYRDGERFRVELYDTAPQSAVSVPTLQTTKISDGKKICFIDNKSGESGILPYDASILPENEAGIPSVDELLLALAEFPESEGAPSSDNPIGVRNTTLKLVRTELGNVYYVAFTYGDIGLVEEYYVSLEHRAVISMTSTENGKTVYSYAVNSISDDADVYTSDGLYDISKASEQ